MHFDLKKIDVIVHNFCSLFGPVQILPEESKSMGEILDSLGF